MEIENEAGKMKHLPVSSAVEKKVKTLGKTPNSYFQLAVHGYMLDHIHINTSELTFNCNCSQKHRDGVIVTDVRDATTPSSGHRLMMIYQLS